MSNKFNLKPDINTLHYFSQNRSLIEGTNFAKALRLFIIAESIYSENGVDIDKVFTYSHWQNLFFVKYFPPETIKNISLQEQEILLNNIDCNGAKTIRNLLFERIKEEQWKDSFLKSYHIYNEKLNNLLNHGLIEIKNSKTTNKLVGGRLFAITRKTLQNHFKDLVFLKYLDTKDNSNPRKTTYIKVEQLPKISQSKSLNLDEYFYKLFFDFKLATASDNFKDKKRFFIKFQHIINGDKIDQVGNIIDELRIIWQEEETPLVKFNYQSSSLKEKKELIVYPICLFYNQRCIYLVGYGSMPNDLYQLNYYNYRLDHICQLPKKKYIQPLGWDEEKYPEINWQLVEKKEELHSQNSESINNELEKALGVDLHREIKTMLLRFPEPFHRNYIEGSNRHYTFQRLFFEDINNFLKQLKKRFKQYNTEIKNSDELLIKKVIKAYPDSAYYTMNYRHGKEGGNHVEADVIMRLRAWCPNVEVLLPWDLRQRMKDDIQKTWQLYHN